LIELCTPLDKVLAVIVTLPAVQVPVPTDVTLSYSVTVEPVTHDMVNAGVALLVILSVLLDPVSEAVSISGIPVVLGAVVFIVIDRLLEADPTFPAVSVSFALMLAWVAADNVDAVMVTVLPAQVPVPILVTLSYNVTVLPVVHTTVNDGVVLFVILSVLLAPVSEADVISGVPVPVGAVVLIVIDSDDEYTDVFPAASVCFARIVVCVPLPNTADVIVTVDPAHVPVPIEVTLL
jgi:hypothetical protein